MNVHCTDAGRRKDLVPREHEEIAADLLHVHRHVRHGLRPVDQHPRVVAFGGAGHLRHRQHRADAVRSLRERDQLGARAKQSLVSFQHHLAAVVHRNHTDNGALLLGDQLPRHNVGVMLQRRDDDLVARLQELAPVRLRDEVDAFGRAADKDDILAGGRAQKGLHLLPGLFKRIRGARGQRVRPAVNVRIVVLVEPRDRVDHTLRLLRGGAVVHPRQRLAVHLLSQHRKIFADGRNVQRPRAGSRCRSSFGFNREDPLKAFRVLPRLTRAVLITDAPRADLLHERTQAVIRRSGRAGNRVAFPRVRRLARNRRPRRRKTGKAWNANGV